MVPELWDLSHKEINAVLMAIVLVMFAVCSLVRSYCWPQDDDDENYVITYSEPIDMEMEHQADISEYVDYVEIMSFEELYEELVNRNNQTSPNNNLNGFITATEGEENSETDDDETDETGDDETDEKDDDETDEKDDDETDGVMEETDSDQSTLSTGDKDEHSEPTVDITEQRLGTDNEDDSDLETMTVPDDSDSVPSVIPPVQQEEESEDDEEIQLCYICQKVAELKRMKIEEKKDDKERF